MTPREIFDKQKGYTNKKCTCNVCSLPYEIGTCDRDYEYLEWLEKKYIQLHKCRLVQPANKRHKKKKSANNKIEKT
jgi:hypothetical protein